MNAVVHFLRDQNDFLKHSFYRTYQSPLVSLYKDPEQIKFIYRYCNQYYKSATLIKHSFTYGGGQGVVKCNV